VCRNIALPLVLHLEPLVDGCKQREEYILCCVACVCLCGITASCYCILQCITFPWSRVTHQIGMFSTLWRQKHIPVCMCARYRPESINFHQESTTMPANHRICDFFAVPCCQPLVTAGVSSSLEPSGQTREEGGMYYSNDVRLWSNSFVYEIYVNSCSKCTFGYGTILPA
jgi:hypothetical protein